MQYSGVSSRSATGILIGLLPFGLSGSSGYQVRRAPNQFFRFNVTVCCAGRSFQHLAGRPKRFRA